MSVSTMQQSIPPNVTVGGNLLVEKKATFG